MSKTSGRQLRADGETSAGSKSELTFIEENLNPTSMPEVDDKSNLEPQEKTPRLHLQPIAHPPARNRNGPRTARGKAIASRNALKHGIFSDAIVLKGESRERYQSLLKSLWETLEPEGRLEELLVEKLAAISWRHRRLLVAESAEIRKNTEFLEWDQQNREREEAEEIGSSAFFPGNHGLMRKICNPNVLERCLELLAELRQGIETDGFDKERDESIFRRVYGDESHLYKTLWDEYLEWLDTAEISEGERKRQGCATPEQCKQIVLRELGAEIRRLERYQKAHASVECDRTKLEMLRRGIPHSTELDHLLRYETSMERAFDRALGQLERVQRLRRGQPVAPRIDVNVTS